MTCAKSRWGHEFKQIFLPGKWGARWRLKQIENFLDTPIDNLKHKINGAKFLWWTIDISRWMKGAGDPDK